MMPIELLFVAILTTYRLTLLVSKEAGPFDLMGRFRTLVGVQYDAHSNPFATNQFAEMILCPYCLSIWLGICITVFIFVTQFFHIEQVALFVMLPFALSGISVFMFRYAGT